jgi:NTP pyrophosphatase (non-canonical NTP hydrolase)
LAAKEAEERKAMHFDEYQQRALKTAQYPDVYNNLVYPAMGLAGEAGEYCDKVKKMWRNKGVMDSSKVTLEERVEMIKELGDILWYIAASAKELDVDLSTVAFENLNKLESRRARGVIKSSGDNR